MVGEIGKLIASICFELAELATKCVLAYNVVFSDHIVTLTKYRAGYATVTSLSIIFLGISFVYRFKHARWVHVKLARVTSMSLHAAADSSAGLSILPHDVSAESTSSMQRFDGPSSDATNAADDDDALESDLVRNLRWEIEKTSRDMISHSLSIGMIFFKDIPAVRPSPGGYLPLLLKHRRGHRFR